MNNVVEFLDTLSRETQLTDADYQSAVSRLDVNAQLKAALLARDAHALATLTQAPTTVFCGLFPSENEPQDDQPQQDEPVDAPAEGQPGTKELAA